jgi:hypothetical protein
MGKNTTPQWSAESLLRAVKASVREECLARKHGTTCSSFITFCYQAAAINQRMGDLAIPDTFLQLLKGENTGCVKLKQSAPNLVAFFEKLHAEKKLVLPQGVFVDAKTTYVKLLQKDLQQPGSGFQTIGAEASWNGRFFLKPA